MAIVSTARADYIRPNVRIGQSRKPKRVANDWEIQKINKAVNSLNEARKATNEAEFLVLVSNAMKLARDIWRGRDD